MRQGSSDTLPRPKIPLDKLIIWNENLPEKKLIEVHQKYSDQLKDEFTRAGKIFINLSPETEPRHQDMDAPETLMKIAQDTVKDARSPHNKDRIEQADSTLQFPVQKQNQLSDSQVPVPPALTESPTAPPQVPNPYKTLDVANAVKHLLQQPKSKLSDSELSFKISPQVAASNLELLKKHDYDLKALCNQGRRSATSFGSEFKNVSMLEKLFTKHPRWKQFKDRLTEGVNFITEKLDEK